MNRATRADAYFDRLASEYRAGRYGEAAGPFRGFFFAGRKRAALDLLGPRPGRTLDLGSGPGVLSEELAARGAVVFPLDLSPAMARSAGPRAVVADARRIPFRDGTFDTVVALGLTTYVEDLPALLAEIARVLRPGGRVVASFTRRAAPDTILRAAFRAAAGRLVAGRGLLGAGVPIRARGDAEILTALRRSGLEVEAARGHNATVFPFVYIFPRASLRLAARLEDRPAGRPPSRLASDLLVAAIRGEPPPPRPVRVARVIARLNVGGPAIQAILLARRLPADRYRSLLVTGRVAPDEGDLTPAAVRAGAAPLVLPGLGRAPSPLDDLRALAGLVRLFARFKPRIVHTHTAKAGTLGRIAAVLAGAPVRIHTFHGHVLHGYFGRFGSAVVREAERILARLSTVVIAVSEEVADDLVRRHRAIPRSKIRVVPLGLPLGPFLAARRGEGGLRAELGIPPDAPLFAWAGRVTAVKDPFGLVEAFRRIAAVWPAARLVVAGDGDLGPAVRAAAAADETLASRVHFLGFRDDLPRLFADADLVLLTSVNEGTPVALIEAAAAGAPAVATRVGGVPAVVVDGVTGRLVPPRDPAAFAAAALELLADPARRAAMGDAAREHVRERFSEERLLADLDRLYRAYSR